MSNGYEETEPKQTTGDTSYLRNTHQTKQKHAINVEQQPPATTSTGSPMLTSSDSTQPSR